MKERLDLVGNAAAYAKTAQKAVDSLAQSLARVNKAQVGTGAVAGARRGSSVETQLRREAALKMRISRQVARYQQSQERRTAADYARGQKQQLRARLQQEKAIARAAARSSSPRAQAAGGASGASGLAMLGGGAAGLAVGAAFASSQAIGAVGKLVYDAETFKQSTMFAFKALLGSEKAAQEAWNAAKQTSTTLGIGLQESAGSLNSLLAQGFKLGDADILIKQMADLKTINPAANLEGIVRAITQIKSTGKLQGDELMQLNEAGLASSKVYEQLAKSLGKPLDQIQKLQSEGKITSDQAIAAIQAAISSQTGKAPGGLAAEAASKTLAGSIGRLGAAKDALIDRINVDSGPLVSLIDRVVAAFNGNAGDKFVASIERLGVAVNGVFDALGDKQIASIFDGAASVVSAWATSIDWATRALQALNTEIPGTAGQLTWLQAAGNTALAGLTFGLSEVPLAAGMMIDSLVTQVQAAYALGEAIVDGIAQGILAAPGKVVDAIKSVIDGAIAAADAALDTGSPSKVFHQRGVWAIQGLQGGAESEASGGAQTFRRVVDQVMGPPAVPPPRAAAAATTNERAPSQTSISNTTNLGGLSLTVDGGQIDMDPRTFARLLHRHAAQMVAARG